MSASPFALPLATYRFTCRAVDTVSLPALADPLWRSLFGLALKRLSCGREGTPCGRCSQRFACDYPVLLMGFNRPDDRHGITRRMRTVPTPLVFCCQVRDHASRIPPGSTFSVRLTLVGTANDRLAAVIRAMAVAGGLGLGRKRARFSLLEVVQDGPQPPERLVMDDRRHSASGRPAQVPIPAPPRTIRFLFLSPCLLPSDTDPGQGFDGARLVMQIVRRISAMHEPYAGRPLDADFRHLKDVAARPFFLDGDIQAEPGYSYHANNKRFLAIRGSFLMRLADCAPLWPWLYLGQWLGVGKQASKGFGRYRLQVVEQE